MGDCACGEHLCVGVGCVICQCRCVANVGVVLLGSQGRGIAAVGIALGGSQCCGITRIQLALVDGIAVRSAIGHVVDGGAAGTGQRQVALGRAVVGDRVGRASTAPRDARNGCVQLALVACIGRIDPNGNIDQAELDVHAV